MVLYLLQQFGGINAITYFSTSILQAAGVRSATLGSAALGACSCAATVAAAGLIDRLGRRRLLELSYGGMALSALLIGLALHWQQAWPTLSSGVTLGATVAYILAFGVGSGPVTGLLVPELVPARLRARGVSLAFASHWVCNFVVGQCFLPAADRWGVATLFFFFAAVCGLATKFVSFTLVGDKFAA
ncbi:sugar transporter [Helicosporidium sp. ATCC 50920]|nr:sugar transporter [Helicosporidium sp. ATCC 50920]|eukprot:KDD76650.1 sugar transporter [Helicosporidium sp. ATCC 50920]